MSIFDKIMDTMHLGNEYEYDDDDDFDDDYEEDRPKKGGIFKKKDNHSDAFQKEWQRYGSLCI